MIITRENLQAGYEWWNKTGWPADFHNVEYHDIYDVRGKGDKEWWNATLNRLANW